MAKRGDGAKRHADITQPRTNSLRASLSRDGGLLRALVQDPLTDETQQFDLSEWLEVGEIADAVAEGFRLAALLTKRSTTRLAYLQNLSYGFLPFCLERAQSKERSLEWKDFNSDLISDFIGWLNAYIKEDGEPLSVQTKMHRLGVIKKIAQLLRFEFESRGIECAIKRNPWPNGYDRSIKTKPLDLEEYRSLLQFAAAKTIAIIEELGPSIDRLQRLRESGRVIDNPQDMIECCQYVLQQYGNFFPERKRLSTKVRETVDRFEYSKMRRVVFPQANDLIAPFMFVLTFGGSSLQPLAELPSDQITSVDILGCKRTVMTPMKWRAHRRERRSYVETEETLNPVNVVRFVEKWTSIVRENAPLRIKKHIFLVACRNKHPGSRSIRSFGEARKGRFNIVPTALMNLLKGEFDHFIGPRRIRASYADLANLLLDGNLEQLGILLCHGSMSVTDGAYRAHAARQRDAEALAGGMAMRQRLIESAGKVDPRPLPNNEDRSAATPGWTCLDPMASPITGQHHGKLCQAYGRCPECPLGNLHANSLIALARALQLLERMEQARDEVGVGVFRQQFGASYDALVNQHIPSLLTRASLDDVKRLSMNPIPRLI